MKITIKLKESVDSIPELSRTINAFETLDEIYRLIKNQDSINSNVKIDFRRKEFKDIVGSKLSNFKVSSPPLISVDADSMMIAAILYLVNNYSNVKQNIIEMYKDSSYLTELVNTIGEEQFIKASISASLFAEKMQGLGDKNIKWLKTKIEVAERIIHKDNIKSIQAKDDD